MRNYRATGPVDVPDDVLAAMATPMISHRSAEFRRLLGRVVARLRPVFGTTAYVLPLTCSGTGGLEAAAGSVLRTGDRVLSVQAGYFGERFARIAQRCGARVDVLAAPWGEVPATADLADRVAAGYDAVLLTHNETSTGVLAPLPEWLRAIRARSDCLVLVDVVSSLGATPIGFDALRLDVAVGVTQKALACPPGISLIGASKRAIARAATGHYLSLADAAAHVESDTTTYTPAMSVLYALDTALAAIEREGLPQVWRRHRDTAARCSAALAAEDLDVIPAPALRSPTVTAVRLPGPVAAQVRGTLEREHNVWVSSGRAQWQADVLRIGHMGPVDPAQVDACAAAMGTAIRTAVGTPHVGQRSLPRMSSTRRRP